MGQKPNPVFSSINETIDYNNFEVKERANYSGMIFKTLALLGLSILGAIGTILLLFNGQIGLVLGLLVASGIVSFICVFIGMRTTKHANIAASIYSLMEGVSLGLVVLSVEYVFPGIAISAALGTVTIFFVMLLLHASRTLRASARLNKVLISILLSSVIISLITSISMIFTDVLVNLFFGTNALSLVLCLIMVVVGSLMLLSDFDAAERVANGNYGKNEEWKVSLGLMVSIVYIFYRVLRLLLIIASRASKD